MRRPAGWDGWTKQQKKAHQDKLDARKTARHQREDERRTAAGASSEGEATTDFEELLKRETTRQKGLRQAALEAAGRKGAAQAPKTITMARENLTEAFDFLGGVPALVVWGRQNRTEFYRIWARLIPKEAAPESENMPLEQLLAKLASRESMSVAEAAYDIGMEALEKGRQGAEAEDMAAALAPPPPNYEIN